MPVSVSGLSGQLDTQSIIQKLVEAEKAPIYRLQKEKKEH